MKIISVVYFDSSYNDFHNIHFVWRKNMLIRLAKIEDLKELLEIYNYAIKNLTATFDLVEQNLEERKPWFDSHRGKYPLLVAEVDGEIAGYCSLSSFKDKQAYEKTGELSIYLSPRFFGRGIGKALMKEIIQKARELNYHSIISVITDGNEISVKLHEKFGFKHAGCLKEAGYKFDKWIDVHYYQLIL